MQYTNHYNLNLPEGSDIVNPLVQDNPNYSVIDTALYDNKVRTVGNAAEVKSGTVHAITRSDSDIDVIRFTATGNWETGDTMTVDGSPVSVYLPDGTAPLTGAYVINTEVVAVINGSRVTLQLANPHVAPTAAEISYDNSGSDLAATNVQDAIDEIVSDVPALLGGVVKIVPVSTTINVTANAYTEASLPISVIPGYTCVGTLTFSVYVTSTANVAVQRVAPNSGGTAMVVSFISNTSGTNKNVTVTLLYVKNEYIA